MNNVDSRPIKSKIFAMMEIKGQPVRFQVDSGAMCNVISKNDLELDTNIEPVKQSIRRIPVAMKPKLKQELARLEELGIIKAVDTPTDWVSSLVLVKKPNSKLRVCIDPQPFNKALKRSHYLLPVIDDLLPDLSKAKVFSVCDVKNGFWHVELDCKTGVFGRGKRRKCDPRV